MTRLALFTPRLRCLALCTFATILGCSTEEPRTQITLLIDADSALRASLGRVDVDLASGPADGPSSSYAVRSTETFTRPVTWPIVIVLVPRDNDVSRGFRVHVHGDAGAEDAIVRTARSRFIKGRNLVLSLRLDAACRSTVFGSCGDGRTCAAESGEPICVDERIDPAILPDFVRLPDSPAPGVDSGTGPITPGPRELTGRVYSSDGLRPLEGALIHIGDRFTVTTDNRGEFTAELTEQDELLFVQHPDHGPVIKSLPGAASIYLEVISKRVDVRATVSGAAGGMVQGPAGMEVMFPPGAFKIPGGAPVTSMADVTLAAPNTKDPTQAQTFPGDFPAQGGGKQGPLAVLTTLDISASSGNTQLTLADTMQADVSFPVSEIGAKPTADLWSFDAVEQRWKHEGQATLTRNAQGHTVYRAKISHLSWWAVGDLLEGTTCLRLCAEYDGAPAPYSRVTAVGIDQPVQGSFYTDAIGCVAFDVPANTQLSIAVQSVDGIAPPRVIVTDAEPAQSDNPASCADLGTVVLVDRDATASACPGGYEQCGPRCVDTRNDSTICGGCGSPACQDGERCINGTCGCPNGTSRCNGECIDVNTNPLHCGACGTQCAADSRCDNRMCAPVTCTAGTTNCDGVCVDLTIDGVDNQCPAALPPGMCTTMRDCPNGELCVANRCMTTQMPECVTAADCAPHEYCDIAIYRCVAFDCGDPMLTYCQSAGCVNLMTSSLHCGNCEHQCPSLTACNQGMCEAPAICGDGRREPWEQCDDGNVMNGDGCNSMCAVEPGFMCPMPGSLCVPNMQCVPQTCAEANANCGFVADGCGGMLQCGDCPPPQTCGGGGTPNICGTPPSTDDPCDGLDNDADGNTDEGHVPTTCGSNIGDCTYGMTACMGGTIVCLGATGPVAETCDARDNDCDGVVDEAASGTCGLTNASGLCMFGQCYIDMCNPGWGNCDGIQANGCETDTMTNPLHCSVCNNSCTSSMCTSGVCQP